MKTTIVEALRRLKKWLLRYENFVLINCIAAIAAIVGWNIHYVYRYVNLKHVIAGHPAVFALVLAVTGMLFGSLVSDWKHRALRSYAITEIAFGSAFIFNVAVRIAPDFDFSKMLAVGSAVYVIARGFNNLTEATSSPDRKPMRARPFPF